MKKILQIYMVISLAFILSACGAADESAPFTIGVIPAQTEGSMESAMEKLQTTISEGIGKDVKVEVYPDYNGVVEAMNYNKIDMAYFGPLTYVIAHKKSGAQAIITQVIDGKPYYHSYVITHKDNPWNSLEDLLQARGEIDFAFGDINSTSGSLIPSIELQDRGVYQSEDEHEFKSVRFTGSHDATGLAVQNQQVSAGAIDSAIFNQLVQSGKLDGDQLKVIWTSKELFQYPWAVHKDLDTETIKALQDTFLDITDPEILDAFGATGFTTATNEDYESIKQAAIKQGIIEE